MRRGTLLVVLWLAIGAAAAGQRGYYDSQSFSCTEGATIAITLVTGPLNYIGLDPKLLCKLPSPTG
jgi:hypothetical protein